MWHMTNLRNYMELSTIQENKTCWENVELTAFLKNHSQVPKDRVDAIMTCFHIVESVSYLC